MPDFHQPGERIGPPALRIVTVTHFYPAHGGGLEKVAERLAEGLARRGFEISWFSSDTDPAPVIETGRVVAIPVAASNIIEKLTQLPYPIWKSGVLPQLWRAIGDSHIVHVHEHLYFPSILAIIMARMRRRPVVITQHMGALGLGSRSLTLLYETGARTLGSILFPLAARNIFISCNVLRFFGRERSKRSHLIFNGADTHRFSPASREERAVIRTSLSLPQDRRIVLFVGRFVRKKGLHRIIALARQFPEVHWVLVGSGPEAPEASLPNVVVAGRVEHNILPQYYRAADLLILPSSGEGLPLVVQEALCCGTGILSTDEVANACPEATRLIRAMPVPRWHDDLAGWSSALSHTLDDPVYLDDARAERAEHARTLWSWEDCISRYDEMFSEIAGAR
jgi:glycosyltransferase involved in cell wall biosynthesis